MGLFQFFNEKSILKGRVSTLKVFWKEKFTLFLIINNPDGRTKKKYDCFFWEID